MLKFLELYEGKVKVLEERSFDRDLARANTTLKVLAKVHVAGVSGQVGQVDRAVGILCRNIDSAIDLTHRGAFGQFDEFGKLVHFK